VQVVVIGAGVIGLSVAPSLPVEAPRHVVEGRTWRRTSATSYAWVNANTRTARLLRLTSAAWRPTIA